MAKTRVQKEEALQALTDGFKEAKSVAFADYRGLTVPQVDELRAKMRESDVRYIVAKKTLVTRAAKDAGIELNAKQFDGMLGVAFAMADEVAAAKVLGDMSKTTSVQIVGGIFEGEVADQAKAVALSKLPSKLELRGTVVGTIYAPVSAFVRVLNAIREEREKTEGAPAAEEAPVAESAPEAPVTEEAPAEEAKPETVEAPAEETPTEEVKEEAPAESLEEPKTE